MEIVHKQTHNTFKFPWKIALHILKDIPPW